MIEYDPHNWRSHLLDIRGSMVREIVWRMSFFIGWSLLVVAIVERFQLGVMLDLSVHSLVGLAIGLLLVFRTNSSYDRFWEGRKLWGGIVNTSRNLARAITVHLPDQPQLQRELLPWVIAFPYAAMHALRKPPFAEFAYNNADECERPGSQTPNLGVLSGAVEEDELRQLCASQHLPLAVCCHITTTLKAARDQGQISDYIFVSIDQYVGQFIDLIGGCERIHKTPMPYAYMVHARRALILYLLTLPLALCSKLHWWSAIATACVAFVFLGIEEIGVEIEDPFGQDDNDLPLEKICKTIENNIVAIMPGD
ncbi:MAG: bestrophin family ion channel [Pirellulaceae bacterium]|nr:hypothetical protein [Planctomycetales bacterium]